MNKRTATQRNFRFRSRSRGQSAVELASITPILVLMLLAVVDFGRFFYVSIAVHSAARAGAQYGSQSVESAADLTGMTNAANTDWNNSQMSLTATPSQCTCASSSNSVAACPSDYCTVDSQANFVEVDTAVTFTSVMSYLGVPASAMNYLGVPTSGSLTAKAIMQVQQ